LGRVVLSVKRDSEDDVPAKAGRANATLTAIDQVFSSASNALVILALAQVATVGQFGIAALLMAVITMCLGFNRGAIGTVLLLLSNYTPKQIRSEGGYALTWSFGTLCVASCALLVMAAALGEIWLGVAFAIVAPIIAMQDTLRLAALTMGNALAAVISDGLWTLWVAVLFIVNALDVWRSTEGSVYVWGLGAAVGWLVLMLATRVTPRFWRIFEWWSTYWRARIRFGVNYSLDQVGAVLMTGMATVIVGTAAAASLRGAFTLFGPLAMLITAFMLIFVPQVRRATDSVTNQWRRMVIASAFLSLLGLGTVAILLSIPDSLGTLLLGEVWQPAMTVVPYVGISSVAVAWLVSTTSMLAAQGMSVMLVRLHIVQVVLIVVFSAIGGFVFHTAAGIAAGEAVASWIAAAILLIFVTNVVRRLSADEKAPQQDRTGKASSRQVLT
jgi:O-antigen/teichoic acid export membrane protein